MEQETVTLLALIFGVLFMVSEGLALIPVVKSNSVFQMVYNFLKWGASTFKKKDTP